MATGCFLLTIGCWQLNTDKNLQANQRRWDRLALEHENAPFYDLAGFKAGKDRLRSIELSELGDVSGQTLLHLQCHFRRAPAH